MAEENVSRAANWRATANALRNQYEAEKVLVYEGHVFKITESFLGYIHALVSAGVKEITVLDASSIPCLIPDSREFLKLLIAKHVEAMNTLALMWAAQKNEL